MKIVIALGGNALGNTPEEQQENIKNTISKMTQLIKDNDIIITHGNGPQVGIINLAFESSSKNGEIPYMPLVECGSMSQGYIGYHIEKALRDLLTQNNIDKKVATILTLVEVDKNDSSLKDPSKPIGLFYTKEEAEYLSSKNNEKFIEDSGRGYRKVVASPKPSTILEIDTIKYLLENNHIVITCGGGGIPILNSETIIGVNGVIDKDKASSLLAKEINADKLIILTTVNKVYLNYNKPNQKEIDQLSVDEAYKYINEEQFSKGSMLPKIEAAIEFVKDTKKLAYITTLDNINNLDNGTIIYN